MLEVCVWFSLPGVSYFCQSTPSEWSQPRFLSLSASVLQCALQCHSLTPGIPRRRARPALTSDLQSIYQLTRLSSARKVRCSLEPWDSTDRVWQEERIRGVRPGLLLQAETCYNPHPPTLFSPHPPFYPKAPLISWNLINREPFCELVYWAVATSEKAELEALCCLSLSASLLPSWSFSQSLLPGYKLGGSTSLTGWGVEVVAGPVEEPVFLLTRLCVAAVLSGSPTAVYPPTPTGPCELQSLF